MILLRADLSSPKFLVRMPLPPTRLIETDFHFQFHIEKEICGWTEPIFHPVFSNNGSQALARLPVRDGNNGHYMHVCQLYDNNVLPLTHGAFELTKILAWDEENHIMYVLAFKVPY